MSGLSNDPCIKLLKITRSHGRVTLTISAEDTPLLVSEDIVHRHRLQVGIVLTSSQLQRLKVEAREFQCYRQAARFLAMRDHSVGELRSKLRLRGFEPQFIETITRKYREMGALDDARFAQAVARSILERRPCGKTYLTAYLQKKKISRTLAEQTAEMALRGTEETDLAGEALKKRWDRFSQFELEVARRKAYNYLARRGFSFGAAKAAFERLVSKE